MFSYWEQQSFTHYDHIIIGAGIVGLSVAIELRTKSPKERILILERGMMSTGASSRNAGFACMGSATEILSDLQTTSSDEVLALFEARKEGLEILRKRLGDERIGYTENGSHELIDDTKITVLEQLDYLNQLLMPITIKPAFRLANERISEFGFSATFTKALIENTCEGELNTGKMLRALTDLALESNIEIKTNASVSHFEETEKEVSVFVPDLLRKENWNLNCRQLYICTNAFSAQLLPQEEVIPGRGQVLITQPIAGLKFKGIFHMDDGYFYFREIEDRVLFGGGRHLDFKTERTTKMGLNESIQNKLEEILATVIIPNTAFTIDQRWSGIMAFGPTKTPVVKAFSSRVFGAFRMGGMGVALGSKVAKTLVNTIVEG